MKIELLAFAPTTAPIEARIGKILRTTAGAWILMVGASAGQQVLQQLPAGHGSQRPPLAGQLAHASQLPTAQRDSV